MTEIAEPQTTTTATPPTRWWALDPEAATAQLDTDPATGLSSAEVTARRERYGSNTLTAQAAPSVWSVVFQQLRDPMNIMLIAVAAVSAAIGQGSTALIVGFLVVINVVIGTRQEMLARKSVDALATMQEPQSRVRRDGALVQIPAHDLVPGDIVELEAGDIVPADGRLLRTATMETQEAALTGESTPIGKDVITLADDEVPLGDRANMAFQNTSVTRGTGTMLVTATGMTTQIGNIATLLSSVEKTKSPLQQELDKLTKVLGVIAWTAVAVIVLIGIAARPVPERPAVPGDGRGHLRDPDGPAHVRPGDARVRGPSAGRREGCRRQPQRRRDARGDQLDQLRQDGDADPQRDDGHRAVHDRPALHRRGQRLREDGQDPADGGRATCRT